MQCMLSVLTCVYLNCIYSRVPAYLEFQGQAVLPKLSEISLGLHCCINMTSHQLISYMRGMWITLNCTTVVKTSQAVGLLCKSNKLKLECQITIYSIIYITFCFNDATKSSLWSPYVIGQTIIFSSCFFFFFLLLFFSSPNLSGRKLDVYHTLAHDVALV